MESDAEFQAQRDRAVARMNAGHGLLLRGQNREAIAEYTTAIDLLRALPRQPSWDNSLGAALMNRGYLIHREHGLPRSQEALADFAAAIETLAPVPRTESPWAHRNLAGTLLNRANLLLDLGRADEAREDAARSLALVDPDSRAQHIDAELALKARRVLCDAIGRIIPTLPAAAQDEPADEAGDIVDDALALIRDWSLDGTDVFAPLAVRFFRFGCELCRLHQPHFLGEFVSENIDAAFACAGEFADVARDSLDAALVDLEKPAILRLDDPATERTIETHRSLVAARNAIEARGAIA